MYANFEKLVHIPPKADEIAKTLSQDLKIDSSKLSNSFGQIDSISDEYKFFFELMLLCKDRSHLHPDWSLLAGRIRMLYIKRHTPKTFTESVKKGKNQFDPLYYKFCKKYGDVFDELIDRNIDWGYNIFSVETLFDSYLLSTLNENGTKVLLETPQYLAMRMAVFLWMPRKRIVLNEEKKIAILTAYKDFSQGLISAPSPLQYNAGTKKPQCSSCFLVSIEDDMESIKKGWGDKALISKNNGGIGSDFSALRHSEIGGHGRTKGIVPWIKIDNEILGTVDQGGKRKGSETCYLLDWHIDAFEFVDLKDPFGKDELRARNLFYGFMISDEFMRRVENDEYWSLICPAKTGGLEKTFGVEFEEKYRKLEVRGLNGDFGSAFRRIKARDLWIHILKSQIRTGMPFIVYKDSANRKTNQMNLGTIRTSNLCVEIMQYTDSKQIASCNLSSIPVSKYVTKDKTFDFESLGQTVRRAMRNLAQLLNRNYYPKDIPEIKYSNDQTRPIGIGLQDIAGCFALMDITWDSVEAEKLNKAIWMTMYYHGMDENVKMAKEYGYYPRFPDSPASKGLFQFDLWKNDPNQTFQKYFDSIDTSELISEERWDKLRKKMVEHGIYFSLVFTQMPNASSAHILGNNEAAEPYNQLINARTVLCGQFIITVKYFVKDLEEINMWHDDMINHLIEHQGSIQTYPEDNVPLEVLERFKFLKEKYKTAFELSQRTLGKLGLIRARYQCQSASHNVFMKDPTISKMNAYHFYMWKGGAKTGMYYLRQTTVNPINMALGSKQTSNIKTNILEQLNNPPENNYLEQDHKFNCNLFEKEIIRAPPTQRLPDFAVAEQIFTCNNEEGCVMCSS